MLKLGCFEGSLDATGDARVLQGEVGCLLRELGCCERAWFSLGKLGCFLGRSWVFGRGELGCFTRDKLAARGVLP